MTAKLNSQAAVWTKTLYNMYTVCMNFLAMHT